MDYRIEHIQATEQTDYFAAIPRDDNEDAFVLCGDTEQQARDYAARVGIVLVN